ncbi:glycosyltransferase [Flavobacteriaceae bacterium F08102]|nr:glycosyltransferase [Flavobacteriaceae bacterium F08102]
MIKVVHIARPYAGIEMYLQTLFSHLDALKIENYLLSNYEAKDKIFVNKFGIRIPQYSIDLRREINLVNDYNCLKDLIKIIKEINPDVIHCHSAKAGILGRIVGKRLAITTYYTPHAFSYLSAKNFLSRMVYKTIEKYFRTYPSKIIACSTSEYNRAVFDLNFKEEKVLLWNNSIEDVGQVKSISLTNSLPENFICCVGRNVYQKNIDLLLDVMSIVRKNQPDLKLVLLGMEQNSLNFQKLQQNIQKLGLDNTVILYPWVGRDEVLSIVKLSKLYVSTSRYEGLPYAVIEALALSKPCVLTAVDGHIDLVQNNVNGFLIENMNANKMAYEIVNLVQNNEKLERFGLNSRAIFMERFLIDNNSPILERLYQGNTL